MNISSRTYVYSIRPITALLTCSFRRCNVGCRIRDVSFPQGPNYNDVDDSDVDYDDKEALLALFKPTDILLKRAYVSDDGDNGAAAAAAADRATLVV